MTIEDAFALEDKWSKIFEQFDRLSNGFDALNRMNEVFARNNQLEDALSAAEKAMHSSWHFSAMQDIDALLNDYRLVDLGLACKDIGSVLDASLKSYQLAEGVVVPYDLVDRVSGALDFAKEHSENGSATEDISEAEATIVKAPDKGNGKFFTFDRIIAIFNTLISIFTFVITVVAPGPDTEIEEVNQNIETLVSAQQEELELDKKKIEYLQGISEDLRNILDSIEEQTDSFREDSNGSDDAINGLDKLVSTEEDDDDTDALDKHTDAQN